ncbi:MAG: (d)CMP kinase [Thermoplasmata archaeon]
MIHRVVTIGGPPGSGKSTAGRFVAEALGLELCSAGELFRAEALRRGLSLEAFGGYAEAHPEVDRELDRTMQSLAAPGRLLEGRIQGALCRRSATPVHALTVTAEENERARRVAGRDHQTLEEARQRIREREASERARYLRFYDIDLARERSDLEVDSTEKDARTVAAEIVAFLREQAGRP